jgi:HAD superfamily hydrolase (TIGR01509 family)
MTADQLAAPAAVLWDMDGTLVETERVWDVSLHEAGARLGRTLSDAERESLVGSGMGETVRGIHRMVGAPTGAAALRATAAFIRGRAGELFAGEVSWCPGARAALQSVRAAGVPSALVTSTERSLTELVLGTIGRASFDVVICGDEVGGQNKPAAEPYARAARLLGAPAQQCLAVEDSAPGVASARAAGACVLLVRPTPETLPPGPGTAVRDSLVGVDVETLAMIYRSVRAASGHGAR